MIHKILSRKFTSNSVPLYDVVIVGGGSAGLSLACSLRSNIETCQLRVAVIEGVQTKWEPAGLFSSRTVSLTPSTVGFLQGIGVWKFVDQGRIQGYKDMKVWDGVSGSRITFPSQTTHGFITEVLNLQHGLAKRVDEVGQVDVFSPHKVVKICKKEEFPVVHLNLGKTLEARLVVGADGINSLVRSFANIESRGWDYGHGVVATLKLSQATETAWQRFLPTGPIALLPLPDGYASLVWSTTTELARKFASMSSLDFSALVTAAFRMTPTDLSYIWSQDCDISDQVSWRLEGDEDVPPRVEEVHSVACFPLRMRHADRYISERVALIGDAAHTIHPLAGQGLNMGMQDVQALTGVLREAVYSGSDIGSQTTLEEYNRLRYFDNHLRIGVCDKLHKLYSTTWAPIVGIRSVGVQVFERMGWLKQFCMETAKTSF